MTTSVIWSGLGPSRNIVAGRDFPVLLSNKPAMPVGVGSGGTVVVQ